MLAWQRAIELGVECERVAVRLPTTAAHLASQIRRASSSIAANIAEGNGRFSRPEYLRHLSIANGSLRELQSHLLFIERVYLSPEATGQALELCELAAKLLGGLIRALRGRGKREGGNKEGGKGNGTREPGN